MSRVSLCCFSSQLLGFFAVFQKKHYVLLILCALGLPLPSYTCIRQVAIQVELVRACSEAGACDSVSTGLCITAFYRCVLLLFIVHLLSRVSVLRVSEMFSHLHHPQCCVIRLCSRAVCALLGWEEIQGQLQQSREILQGRNFPVLSLLPQHLAFTIIWLIKGRVSALTHLVRLWIPRKELMCWSLWEQRACLFKVHEPL